MLAVTEAILGQLYLVSAVALLVGNLGRTRTEASTARRRTVHRLAGALAGRADSDDVTIRPAGNASTRHECYGAVRRPARNPARHIPRSEADTPAVLATGLPPAGR